MTKTTGNQKKAKYQRYYDAWKVDFALFAKQAIKINAKDLKNKKAIGSQPIPLVLNPAQQLIHDSLGEQLDPRILILKARQVGSSTYCVLFFLWMCLFIPGRRIAIVAQQASSAKTILKMAGFALSNLPSWMKKMKRFKAKVTATQIVFANGSSIQAGTANSEFWRGGTYDGVLLTEATSYNSLEETMDAILPACTGPAFIESTAKGMGKFKDLWDDKNVAWTKVFISWLIDAKAHRDFTSQKPIAEDEAYIIAHKLSPTQRNWYLETKWTVYSGNQKRFDQEAPATAELAFIVAGNKFFAGKNFQYDPKETPAQARHDWQAPIKGHRYLLGIDVASGSLEGDASTGVLLDVTNPKNIQVSSVMQCWLPTPLFANELITLCKDYGPYVLAVVETNVGLDIVRSLKKAGIRQYTRQRDSKMIEQVDEYGFHTNTSTRPLLMASLTRNVMGGVIEDLADPRLKYECNNFIYDKTGKPVAASGKHDDLVLALALALQGLEQLTLLSVAPTPAKIPVRPVHDVQAMLAHDKKYGIKRTQKAPY